MLLQTFNQLRRVVTPVLNNAQVATMSRFKRVILDDEAGPQCWSKTFPQAAGHKQSPIDIVRASVQPDPFLLENPLSISYQGVATKAITNGGFGWRVDVSSEAPNIQGGPLNHRYKLLQFHSHWGDTCCDGSEHTVDGESFSGELHLVHYNMDMYDSPSTASCSQTGLAVVGVFLKEGNSNPEFDKICHVISKIKHKEGKTTEVTPFDIPGLLPNDTANYWTYEGSLTTPPCYESVTWIVLKQPIEVSKEQLDTFRTMVTYCEDDKEISALDGPVMKNWRSCQPIEDRVIREPGRP